jgi:hypothetical protein
MYRPKQGVSNTLSFVSRLSFAFCPLPPPPPPPPPPGLKSRLTGTTAAPAGIDEINPDAEEYASPAHKQQQQQGSGGMMGAVRRVVGM